jgi:hypothetical protein
VERAEGDAAPEGSKALGTELLALLIKTGIGTLPAIVKTIGDWLVRQPQDTIVEIEVEGKRLSWKGRHPPPEFMAALQKMVE